MFKKFNWGHGIFIFYVVFVGVVVTALIASFGVDHSLVVDDYYAKDLAYQTQYNKVQNSIESQLVTVYIDKTNKDLTIAFINEAKIEGTVDFYRPSDKTKDFNIKLLNQETKIPTDNILPGKWILKLDWVENGKSYYKEELIYL